jgi:hypothetical protein
MYFAHVSMIFRTSSVEWSGLSNYLNWEGVEYLGVNLSVLIKVIKSIREGGPFL